MDVDDGFRTRLERCVATAGSLYALAKRAGLGAPTIRKYLTGSEPTRPFLIAIARAANVSLDWLCTGASVGAPESAEPSAPSELDLTIRERIKISLAVEKAANLVASQPHIWSPSRLEQLRRAEVDAKPSELLALAQTSSLVWILSDRTEVGTPREAPRWLHGQRYTEATRLAEVAHLKWELSKDVARLSDFQFIALRVTTQAMAPRIRPGEVVIADFESRPGFHDHGIFVVLENDELSVCYVSRDDDRIVLSFENKQISPLERSLSDDQFRILGRVVKKFGICDV